MNDTTTARAAFASTGRTYWPLYARTTRSEQRLLIAFRQLNARLQDRDLSVRRLEATGLDGDGLIACAHLSRLLPLGLPDLHFLEPDSTDVTTEELHFLASLTRMARRSRNRDALARDVPRGALHVAMQKVAVALAAAGFSMHRSASSLPLSERPGPVHARKRASAGAASARA